MSFFVFLESKNIHRRIFKIRGYFKQKSSKKMLYLTICHFLKNVFSSYQPLLWSLYKCLLPISIAAVVRETYSFIKIMLPIRSSYNWENLVKQIKITEENLSQSCILCQSLRTKTLASGSNYIKHFFYFYHYLSYICWVDVIYLICLILALFNILVG